MEIECNRMKLKGLGASTRRTALEAQLGDVAELLRGCAGGPVRLGGGECQEEGAGAICLRDLTSLPLPLQFAELNCFISILNKRNE